MGKDDPIYEMSVRRNRRSGLIEVTCQSDLEESSEAEFEVLAALISEARERICDPLADKIERSAKELAQDGLLSHSTGKQSFAKHVSALLRWHNLAVGHPETAEPCNLIAINDVWGGKFALENRKTKKRSHTVRDITAAFPITLICLDYNEIDASA